MSVFQSSFISAASAAAGALNTMGVFSSLASPIISVASSALRYDIGWNDTGEARSQQYFLDFACVKPRPGQATGSTVKISMAQAVQRYNQENWTLAATNPAVAAGIRNNLMTDAAYNGVDAGNGGWSRLIDLSSGGPSLQSFVVAYYRERANFTVTPTINDVELGYQLSRNSVRRGNDQYLSKKPYYNWTPDQMYDLWYRGWIDFPTLQQTLPAAGQAQPQDQQWQQYLSAPIPDPTTLSGWAKRSLWNETLAATYQLDAGLDQSPLATFFAASQGWGNVWPNQPGQPPGNAFWFGMQYRDSRPMPNFALARQLQYRLRDDGTGLGMSVVPGVPTWTAQNSQDMLTIEGWTPPLIAALQGITYEPINVRILHTTLLQILKHKKVAADAAAAFGDKVDWVMGAYQDHGLPDKTAKLAADAIREQAKEQFFEEKIAAEKELRKLSRDNSLKSYSLGIITAQACEMAITQEQFSSEMATAAIANVDYEWSNNIAAAQLAAIRAAWMGGKLSSAQLQAQLQGLPVTPERLQQYAMLWMWERGEDVRMLSTQQILAALKQGLMPPAVAVTRLSNIGWTTPDAMIEVAQVTNELAEAAAKLAATQAAKELTAQQRAARLAETEAAAVAREQAAAAKAAAKLAAEEETAPAKQAAAAARYDAATLLDQDAYNKAVAANDPVKAQAEIDKAVAAYRDVLLTQVKIATEGADVAKEIIPVAVVPVGPLGPGAGPGPPPAGPA